MSDDRTLDRLLVLAVDCALKGSGYGVKAWEILRKGYIQQRCPTVAEFAMLEELLDRAVDDIEGPQFRVNLALDREYKIGVVLLDEQRPDLLLPLRVA